MLVPEIVDATRTYCVGEGSGLEQLYFSVVLESSGACQGDVPMMYCGSKKVSRHESTVAVH